jgi:hypothetical protein
MRKNNQHREERITQKEMINFKENECNKCDFKDTSYCNGNIDKMRQCILAGMAQNEEIANEIEG